MPSVFMIRSPIPHVNRAKKGKDLMFIVLPRRDWSQGCPKLLSPVLSGSQDMNSGERQTHIVEMR